MQYMQIFLKYLTNSDHNTFKHHLRESRWLIA